MWKKKGAQIGDRIVNAAAPRLGLRPKENTMADTANRESWTRPRDLGPDLLEGPRSLGDCARSPKARNNAAMKMARLPAHAFDLDRVN